MKYQLMGQKTGIWGWDCDLELEFSQQYTQMVQLACKKLWISSVCYTNLSRSLIQGAKNGIDSALLSIHYCKISCKFEYWQSINLPSKGVTRKELVAAAVIPAKNET